MIPLAIPNLAGREAEYLAECVSSTFVSSVGPFVDRFEQQVASAAGAVRGVATASGTTALQAALVSVGVMPGDLVIVPALTFIATANAVSHCHAQPWLLDVSPDSWTLDPAELERALNEETLIDEQGRLVHRATGKRVAAIVPVYTLGMPADMDRIVALGSRFGLPVVADAAAALGATYKGRPPGELGAVLTMFSFNGNKTITAGGGGAIVGNDDAVIARFRHLTTTARVGADYDHDMVGYNFRMTNLQAAVGCAQMEQLPGFLKRKRQIDTVYRDLATRFDSLAQFPSVDWAESACWFSGFVLKHETSAVLRQALRKKGVDARPFWKPMHLQKPYAACPQGALNVSDRVWPSIVTLPCSTGITDKELDTVVQVVTDVLGTRVK
jgi:perosamine synthetase